MCSGNFWGRKKKKKKKKGKEYIYLFPLHEKKFLVKITHHTKEFFRYRKIKASLQKQYIF